MRERRELSAGIGLVSVPDRSYDLLLIWSNLLIFFGLGNLKRLRHIARSITLQNLVKLGYDWSPLPRMDAVVVQGPPQNRQTVALRQKHKLLKLHIR